MNNEFVKACSITQNREEYICMNEQCCTSNRKQLHCYECITKIHRQNNNNLVNHLDDFKKISFIMQEVDKKKKERINFINLAITSLNDVKKEKFQIIESYSNNPKEFLEQVKSYVEKEIDQLIQKLYEQVMEMNQFTEYQQQYHSLIIQLYQQTTNLYIEDFVKKKELLQVKLNNYIKKMDLDLHQQIFNYLQKQQFLEQQMSQLMKQPSHTNSFLFKSTIILILIIIGLNPIIMFQDSNQKNEFQIKIEELHNMIKQFKGEIESENENFYSEFNKTLQDQIYNVKDEIDTINQKINQTETPFNQFKNYFNTKLKQYNETIYSQIIQKTDVNKENLLALQQQFVEQNDKFSIYNNQTSNILNYQQLKDMKIEQDLKMVNKNITFILEVIEQQKAQLLAKIMNMQQKLQNINREQIKEKLLGKIHVDLELKWLKDFVIIYDEFLTNPLNRKIVRQIQNITENDTIICIGGMKVDNPQILLVVGCDYQQEIFQFTNNWQHARKSQQGDIYWYMLDKFAFGFSPKEEILLTLCDDLDPSDQMRFSYWFENGRDGGRRIGNQTQLINSIDYKMQMYAF
ncbi:unnamed protein product [Paramecium sonneborni]|uniref:Uncharacterized protein n=1 Tax=Paramecium sonneborni TaxID=65129 RepID=A0A8S1LGT2_9CILI|nr:unnamed protein product [Paramecium sonneborni]